MIDAQDEMIARSKDGVYAAIDLIDGFTYLLAFPLAVLIVFLEVTVHVLLKGNRWKS